MASRCGNSKRAHCHLPCRLDRYPALFSFLTILLSDRRLLRLMVASLSGLGLSHVLAVFPFAVPFIAFFVEHFGGGVHPHLAATAPGGLRDSRGIDCFRFGLLGCLLFDFGSVVTFCRRRLCNA